MPAAGLSNTQLFCRQSSNAVHFDLCDVQPVGNQQRCPPPNYRPVPAMATHQALADKILVPLRLAADTRHHLAMGETTELVSTLGRNNVKANNKACQYMRRQENRDGNTILGNMSAAQQSDAAVSPGNPTPLLMCATPEALHGEEQPALM